MLPASVRALHLNDSKSQTQLWGNLTTVTKQCFWTVVDDCLPETRLAKQCSSTKCLAARFNWKPLPPLTHWFKSIAQNNCYTLHCKPIVSTNKKNAAVEGFRGIRNRRANENKAAREAIPPCLVCGNQCALLWNRSPDQGGTVWGQLHFVFSGTPSGPLLRA